MKLQASNKILKRPHLSVVVVFFVMALSLTGIAAVNKPVPIDSVDYTRIYHKKVRKLILHQKQYGISTFDDLHPVCYNTVDSLNYRSFTKSQIIRQDINVVWNKLTHQSPSEEFDGRIVTFGLLYSRLHHKLNYKNEPFAGIEEGQILFFNLRVLKGIKNLAVAIEVTRLDNANKTVEYCYLDHGDTKGTQKFVLRTTPDGFTEITQLTRYRCKSKLRDRKLYSFFHERIVKEFLCSIKKRCESIKSPLSELNKGSASGL